MSFSKRLCVLMCSLCALLFAGSACAAEIVFKSTSRIEGAAAMLVFEGYGTTYQKVISKYTATNEEGESFYVQDPAASYLLVNIGYAPSATRKTTIILTYSNGDTGIARFVGGTFHPGPFLDAKTSTGKSAFCEGSDVTLIASGATSQSVTWQMSIDNSNWRDMAGKTDLEIEVKAELGTLFYRFIQEGYDPSNSVSVLGQVCCSTIDEMDVIWEETFSDSTFNSPDVDRFRCPYVIGYGFAPVGTKVDDGYYVVVAKSDAANQELDWPSGKFDHTSGNGKSGFLIINAGDEDRIMYEQKIKSDRGFCEGAYYNLSLWATNITPSTNAPARMSLDVVQIMKNKREIEIVKGYDTGDIEGSSMEKWYNYGVTFVPQDVDNIDSLVIRINNISKESYGNDVVIDDISVSVCNAPIKLYADYPDYDITVDSGSEVTLQAIEEGNLTSHFGRPDPYYLWMDSVADGKWDTIHAASGYGKKEYKITVNEGYKALYKVIIATDGEAAKKAFDGNTTESCVIYTVTNKSKVACSQTGCTKFPTVTLKADHTTLTCTVEKITLTATATGGSGSGYQYSWNGGNYITKADSVVTQTGRFNVMVKDSEGCESVNSNIISISENKIYPDVSITPETAEITCEAASVTLKANAGNVTYLWSTGESTESIVVSKGGTYRVDVTDKDNGCVSNSDASVSDNRVNTEVNLVVNYPKSEEYLYLYDESKSYYLIGEEEPVRLQASIIKGYPTSYDWYVNDKFIVSTSEMSYDFKPFADAPVKVVAHSSCNDAVATATVNVKWPTIVTPYDIDGKNDDFAVGLGIEIRLFDRIGNMQYHGYDGIPVDAMNRLQPGVYFFQAVSADGSVYKSTLELYKK